MSAKVENLDACIKCSACVSRCPVAGVYPIFPGPKAVGPDAERFRLAGSYFNSSLLSYCSNCKTCEIYCPFGVQITSMIARNQRENAYNKSLKESFLERVRGHVLGRVEYFSRIGSLWPSLFNFCLHLKPMRKVMERVIGIKAEAPLPNYRKKFRFRSKLARKVHKPKMVNFEQGNAKPKVVYFPGCFATFNDPGIATAVINVLAYNGLDVIVPDFRCCGVPLSANQRFNQADRNMKHNLKLLNPYLEQGLPVIASCPSCTLALKEEYAQAEAAGAALISTLTYDLFEFLGTLLEKGNLRLDFRQDKINSAGEENTNFSDKRANDLFLYGYHSPCHLLAQGVGTPAIRLLRLIPGVKVTEIDGGCCGMSGSYGLKQEKFHLGQEIGQGLFEKIGEGVKERSLNHVLTDCGMCRVQIEHNTGVSTTHPARILEAAYDLNK